MQKYLALLLIALTSSVRAVDTTPPTLNITHTWIEKAGTRANFKMLLDPADETGLLPLTFGAPIPSNNTIWFRSALNNPNANLSSLAWNWWPWQRGVPFEIGFTCKSCVIEIQARDAAGNVSSVQRRVFQSPFPYSSGPDTDVKLGDPTAVGSTALDCRGLFGGSLDGQGFDDVLQVDRTTGVVTAKRQIAPFPLSDEAVITVSANTIEDSAAADYDKDGRLDLAMIVGGALRLWHNDGLNGSNQLVFTEVTINPGAWSGTTLSTINGVVFGDITGEGKPEIILSGVNGGGETIIGWLDNNSQFTFLSGNKCPAPAASSAGRVAIGDVTGDGFADVVMIDPGQLGVLVFQNDGSGILMGEDRVNVADRPLATQTGGNFGALVPRSLAVGDVTGDGRADAVVMVNWLGSTNVNDSNDVRTLQFWQLLDSRGRVPFHASGTMLLGQSPASDFIVASESARLDLAAPPLVSGNTVSQGAPASLWKFLGGDPSNPTNWQSNALDVSPDVLLQDLNRDRFPEVVLTSQFEPGTGDAGGVRAYQVRSTLNATNELMSFELQEAAVPTNTLNPHRLAAARFAWNKASSILVAHNDTPGLVWVFNNGSETSSTAPVAIIGAASVDTDPDGTDGPNGIPVYTAFPNSLITYTLTVINNTPNPLTNAVIDSLLPAAVTAEDLGGGTIVASRTSNYVRWTETVPANTAITKQFTARVRATAIVGSKIQPKNNIKFGTTNVSSLMPLVTLDEPITFALLSVNSDTDPTGAIVHFGENITYRVRLTNRGATSINNTLVTMNFPAGTKFDGPVTPVPGTTQVVTSSRITITVLSVTPGGYQDLFFNLEAKGADNAVISNSTITAQRPSGSKRTLPAIKTIIKPAVDVEWYSVYSDSSPTQPNPPAPPLPEPLKGTRVHFGEIIRYRPKLINRSSIVQTNVKLTIPVPTNCIFDGPVSAIPGMTYTTPSNKSIIYTIASIPGSTYNPDGTLNTLSLNTDARLDVEERFDLDTNTRLDDLAIVQNKVTVQVPTRSIVTAPSYTLTCERSLELTIRTDPSDLANVNPGGVITYELQAHNWGASKVTSAKVVNAIPDGTLLISAQQDDGTGTAAGPGPDMITGTSDDIPFRSGNFLGNDQNTLAMNEFTNPAFFHPDNILNLLQWNLGQVDSGMIKTMRYKVMVATDLDSAYFKKGVPVAINMLNLLYNFAGTAGSGKRVFSYLPYSNTYAQRPNPDPYDLLPDVGNAPAHAVSLDTSAPLPKPKLQIVKHVVGPRNESLPAKYERLPTDQATADITGTAVKKNDWIFYVENDSTVPNDAICNYTLHYFNTGGATATNVRVKDVIPTGMTFVGFVAKDQVLVPSFAYSHFYDAAGKELDMGVPANVTKVRSFDFYGGDLSVNESHALTYQCVALDSKLPGSIITSTRGGKGLTQGLDYNAIPGYQLSANELHFPVDGSPDAVHVQITAKASFHLLIKDGWKSGHGMAAASAAPAPAAAPGTDSVLPVQTVSEDDEDSITVSMPYDVRGDAGAAPLPPLENMKMTFLLPKGYKTDDAFVNSVDNVKLKTLNASATVEGSGYVSAIRQADGRIKISFPLDGVPFAWPTAHIIYDPQYKGALFKDGYTLSGADIQVDLTGTYSGGKTISGVKSFIHIDSRADASKDGKIFIGRCAPVSVKRGETFRYTIFAGNLTDHFYLGGGSITMTVPKGCDFVSCSDYVYNYDLGPGPLGPDSSDHRAQGTYNAKTRTVTWPIRGMNSCEGGVVTLTVKVQESFTGNSIVDKSCMIKVGNAMPKYPGPSAVVVRDGDVDGQLAEILQRHLQGVKFTHNSGTTTEINKTLQLDANTCGISIGGADVLQFLNGVNLIPLPNDRVMVIAPPNYVVDAAGSVLVNRVLISEPSLRICCGDGKSGGVSLVNISGYTGVTAANQILTDLGVPGLNVLASKSANVLIGGGNNLVRSGSGTFPGAGLGGANAPVILLPNGQAVPVAQVKLAGDVKLIGQDGAGIVAGGGGNATTGQGGQIGAPGNGLIGQDGAGVVATDGAGVIGQSGSAVLSHNGNAILNQDNAGLFSDQGAGLVGQDGASFIGTGVGTLTSVNTGSGK